LEKHECLIAHIVMLRFQVSVFIICMGAKWTKLVSRIQLNQSGLRDNENKGTIIPILSGVILLDNV